MIQTSRQPGGFVPGRLLSSVPAKGGARRVLVLSRRRDRDAGMSDLRLDPLLALDGVEGAVDNTLSVISENGRDSSPNDEAMMQASIAILDKCLALIRDTDVKLDAMLDSVRSATSTRAETSSNRSAGSGYTAKRLTNEDLATIAELLRVLIDPSLFDARALSSWRPRLRDIREKMIERLGDLDDVRAPSERDQRQATIATWAARAFGHVEATSLPQRGVRLLEEALEAFQACGGEESKAHELATYVFGRPKGEIGQELGGVAVTTLALAAAAGLSADEEEQREVTRVLSKPIAHFTERNAAKNAAGFLVAERPACRDRGCLAPLNSAGGCTLHDRRPTKDWNACPYKYHADDCDCGGTGGDR